MGDAWRRGYSLIRSFFSWTIGSTGLDRARIDGRGLSVRPSQFDPTFKLLVLGNS